MVYSSTSCNLLSEDYRRIEGLRAEVAATDRVTYGATKGAELLHSSVPVLLRSLSDIVLVCYTLTPPHRRKLINERN